MNKKHSSRDLFKSLFEKNLVGDLSKLKNNLLMYFKEVLRDYEKNKRRGIIETDFILKSNRR